MIVITTPTGQIGRQVLDHVLGGGEPVRVIARDPARLPDRVRDNAEVVPGATNDVETVVKACAGVRALFWVVPPDPKAESIAGHNLEFAGPLCAAITRQGVERVVAVSSLGRGRAKNAGQISAIHGVDALVESTGVHYRSLCMPGFMDNLLWQAEPIRNQGMFFDSVPGDRRLPSCATRDIAAVASGLLLDPAWTGQENVPMPGPEDLSNEDRARIMSEVLGRTIRFQWISAADQKASLVSQGMSDAWAQGLVNMTAAVRSGIYDLDPATPRAATPTTFRQWCDEVLKPVVDA